LSGRPWSSCPESVLEFEIDEKESKSRSSWRDMLFSVIDYASVRAYEGDLSLIDVRAVSAAVKIPYNSKADRNQISCGRFLRVQVEVDDRVDEMLPFCICSRILG
jgi:hypothetical protein